MGILTDILKDIPLSAVLRERVAEQEKKMTVLEKENTILKAENTVLKAENAKLIAQLQQIHEEQTVQGDICPYCRQRKGQLLNLVPHKIFGDVGVKTGFYRCANCNKEYDKEIQP